MKSSVIWPIQASLLWAFLCLASAKSIYAASAKVPNFSLLDLRGKNHELRRVDSKAVVLFFTGNGCPIARKSIAKLKNLRDQFDDVQFWLVNTYPEDSLEDCVKEYREFKMSPLTYLRDPKQGVALVLGVERTAEVVAINMADRSVFYRGQIDDQLSEGAQKPKPEETPLANALKEFLAGKPVTKSLTTAHGCRIAFEKVDGADGQVSYSQAVAPVLQSHCVECHREDGIGPWQMDSYASVKNYSRMIEEVLLSGQMPPWHADPDYGKWSNDRALNSKEFQTLLGWITGGTPREEAADPLTQPLPPLPEWTMGKPNFVVSLPKPEEIPANGVLDYRHIRVDLPATNELWLAGLEVKPGNRRVVHHVIVRAKWKDGPDDGSGHGVMLTGWAPGLVNARFAEGTGKHVPAGAHIDFEMHYTTTGSTQSDQTQVAFYLLAEKPERELTTRAALQTDLNIAPGADESRDTAIYGFEHPATIYSLMPHMHLRGLWMKFELLQPNGKKETLLNVPRYDFNWQTSYQLAQPRHVSPGSWLVVTGGFDNSLANPNNPDPKKRIHFGAQSWDEMFIGFLDAADDAPSRTQAAISSSRSSAETAQSPTRQPGAGQ